MYSLGWKQPLNWKALAKTVKTNSALQIPCNKNGYSNTKCGILRHCNSVLVMGPLLIFNPPAEHVIHSSSVVFCNFQFIIIFRETAAQLDLLIKRWRKEGLKSMCYPN